MGIYGNIKRFYDFVVSCGYQVAGIIDDVEYNPHLVKIYQGMPIIGTPNTFFNDPANQEQYQFFLSAPFEVPTMMDSNNQPVWSRQRYIELIRSLDLDCITLVAPTAQVADTAVLGRGVYIAGNCVVGNYTNIGDFTQIHDNSIIGNHCTIGFNTIIQRLVTFISHTSVGDNCNVGLHTLVADNNIHIGNDAVIHSGFIIARDIEPGELVHLAGKTFKKIYKLHRTIN